MHLDIKVGGVRTVPRVRTSHLGFAESDRLIGLGATKIQVLEAEAVDHVAVVLQDPAGNDFCVA